ncbi:type VI secretion system baseplate subunit TssG [Falsiroseomonas oryzae]|uniref:type VI secretion system baseplate subunit TssG n=1 Tax=Falsiroseomonas oryzae TaxID=2766473 RepID=UPI0022EB603E|nr:type VI secretion system baseplate subunit TssG [Roseomonas sp. MO-31]
MKPLPSALDRLASEPESFSFDAAMRLLCADRETDQPAEAARFHAPHGLAFPPGDVLRLSAGEGAAPPSLTVGLIGLTGPSGVLPRHYSEAVVQQVRSRARSLPDFLDLLAQRLVAHFAAAGAKYRMHRAADMALLARTPDQGPDEGKVAAVLLALAGHGTPHLADRLAAGPEPLMHYAGLFAMRPRSAERLRALVSDWLGQTVEVVQFAGAWLALPPDQRTRLPVGIGSGQHARLGVDAAIGVRAWDASARVVLRLGPLDGPAFDALLPDRPALARLVSLVRAFLGSETGFAVNPVVAAAAVPPLRLDSAADPAPRLGWNTWLPTAGRREDGTEPLFEAEVVEGFHHARGAAA